NSTAASAASSRLFARDFPIRVRGFLLPGVDVVLVREHIDDLFIELVQLVIRSRRNLFEARFRFFVGQRFGGESEVVERALEALQYPAVEALTGEAHDGREAQHAI